VVHASPQASAGGDHDAAVRAATERELGPETAAALPAIPSTPAEPADPGAVVIVTSIDSALGSRVANDQGQTIISLSGLRNLSRCGSGEFTAFKQRLAGLLTKAGREGKIVFTDDAGPPAHYRMQGTAYLMSAAGFDQWELYLSLTPADRDFAVWDARNAVRVLRIPRAGQPEITYIGH
jgi:hypothetical protein